MGNQCCTSVRYSEEQFNEIYKQKASRGQVDQPYSRTFDSYFIQCGQNKVLINKNNTRIAEKGVYEILLLIHDLFSIIEEEPHQLYVTENLVSFFRNNPSQITNRLVGDSLVELFSETYTHQKILLLIEDSNINPKRHSRQNSMNVINQNKGQSLSSMDAGIFSRTSIQQNIMQNKIPSYQPINEVDQYGLPHYQQVYPDNSPIPNQQAIFSDAIKDQTYDPYQSPNNFDKKHQNQSPYRDNNMYNQRDPNMIVEYEETQSNNYSNRAYNNPNAKYSKGFQSPSTLDDFNNTNLPVSSFNQAKNSQSDTSIIQIIEFIMGKMGTHQLEQTSQKDIWQTWRVFDATNGCMNYHKKYNLLYYGKQAMQIYQKEATVLQQIEDAQIDITPRLMKYDAKNKEIKFEGGYCTLWELVIEMSKIQLRFTEKNLAYITIELVRIIQELDKMNIYHGNIKPQNIVLIQTAEGKYQIRLINFENCTRGTKEKYPNAKTENYYDPINKLKAQSDIMSQQIYQVGRTILNLILKQGTNNNLLHSRKNHPIITQEAIQQYQSEYPTIIGIVSKMLRIQLNQANQSKQNMDISKTAGNGLSERNREDISLNGLGDKSILDQFLKIYPIQQLENDMKHLKDSMRNGQITNYIFDQQGLVKQIVRRRIEMGAWDQSMTSDIFKRELLYILSLGQFERGCELCNYLLNYKSSPNYNAQVSNGNKLTNSQLRNSGNNTSRGNQQDNFQTPTPNPQVFLKNNLSVVLKQDPNKYISYQHEFLVKAQIVMKQLYSKQIGEIIQAYFHVKEELSLFFFQNNFLKESIQEQETLIQEKRNLVENDPAGLSRSLRILGEFNLRQSRFDFAIKYLTQALNIYTKIYKDLLHIEIAETLISMAEVYSQQNDSKKAVQSAIISYDISSQTSPNSLAFAEICIQISQIFMKVYNDHAKAIPYLEKGVQIKIDCFKSTFLNHYLDINLLQLASFFESMKNYILANEYYNILLEIRLSRLTHQQNGSPQVAQAYTLIGFILEKLNQVDKAQANHIKALTMRKQIYGEVHQEVADSLINLSMIHLRKNQFQESLNLQEQALKIKERLMPETADVAQCMNNLAIILETLGNFEEAINYHQKSILIKKKIHGEKSSTVATSYNNLALTHKNSGQHEKAIPLLNQALQIRSQNDPNSEEVISVLTNLQVINNDLGNTEQANKFKEQINNVKIALQQKKEMNAKTQQQEQDLIFKTLNQNSHHNQNSGQININNSYNLNNQYPNQMQQNSALQNNLENSIIQNKINQQATFMSQAGQQNQQGHNNFNNQSQQLSSIGMQNSQMNSGQNSQMNSDQNSQFQNQNNIHQMNLHNNKIGTFQDMNQSNGYENKSNIQANQYQQQMQPNQSQYQPNQSQYQQNHSQYQPNQSQYQPNQSQYQPNQSQHQSNLSSVHQQQQSQVGNNNMNHSNNIFMKNQSNNYNQNGQSMQNSQLRNSQNQGNYSTNQYNNNQINGGDRGLQQSSRMHYQGDDMKQSQNGHQYQNNRPNQLQGSYDQNGNNQRAQ